MTTGKTSFSSRLRKGLLSLLLLPGPWCQAHWRSAARNAFGSCFHRDQTDDQTDDQTWSNIIKWYQDHPVVTSGKWQQPTPGATILSYHRGSASPNSPERRENHGPKVLQGIEDPIDCSMFWVQTRQDLFESHSDSAFQKLCHYAQRLSYLFIATVRRLTKSWKVIQNIPRAFGYCQVSNTGQKQQTQTALAQPRLKLCSWWKGPALLLCDLLWPLSLSLDKTNEGLRTKQVTVTWCNMEENFRKFGSRTIHQFLENELAFGTKFGQQTLHFRHLQVIWWGRPVICASLQRLQALGRRPVTICIGFAGFLVTVGPFFSHKPMLFNVLMFKQSSTCFPFLV